MAIQIRRGNYADFNRGKLLPGEPAAVLAADPNTTDGKAMYISFGDGEVKRLVTSGELASYPDEYKKLYTNGELSSGNEKICGRPCGGKRWQRGQ